ncbi:type II inositol-1,4,5-trisphosphate 5-phosphatase [Xylariomycetidae sp. FL0641]|nr:type II inositol-1,4,5-trisphosphate 5-phosphatase [Xylariomycetidae sp. FL0641]
MASTDRAPSVTSASQPTDEEPSPPPLLHPLARAVEARKDEFVRPHRIRIKVGTWNVAGCPGTDKDLASWFVEGEGVAPKFDTHLAHLNLSESDVFEHEASNRKASVSTSGGAKSPGSSDRAQEQGEDAEAQSNQDMEQEEPGVRLLGGDKIGLYVLGLQEIVSLNLVKQSLYADPGSVTKWQNAIEAALPKGYTLVVCQQLVGLLLLMYASPEVAATISNESTVTVGTGLGGYLGNKGAVTSRILLGETTRIVFSNCHLASGHENTSLERRCWDYNKITSTTKFAPISHWGVLEDEGDMLGDEDFAFCFGDLNFRLDGLPGDDIRRLLMLHTMGEYDITKSKKRANLGEDGVIVLRNNDSEDSDGTQTPGMVSRETSFVDGKGDDDDSIDLPDPDDFVPDPHDDPASLQATLDSLLPHDQLRRVIMQRKAFHEGWNEGPITFLPTYKYDVGTVGLFDSSEKKRAPSWCDRILWRTRKDTEAYKKKCEDEIAAKQRDDEMKKEGIEQAAEDENVLFDYDPGADSSADNLATGDASYDYDEYDETEDAPQDVTTKEGFVDQISLDLYTSHQRVMSSDHKPLVAMFTLNYDAVVPELKAKVHAEELKDLDRAENEGRPDLTVVIDSREQNEEGERPDAREGIDYGEVAFLQKYTRSLTIANTGRVPATFKFADKPKSAEKEEEHEWFHIKFVRSLHEQEDGSQESLGEEITLEPGETVNAVIQVQVRDVAQVRALNDTTTTLDDVIILSVTGGRDFFVPIRATWQPTCFGRSLEELIRIPSGGIRAMTKARKTRGSISNSENVHTSSPTELFRLTEAIETLAERTTADENMLEDCKVPRDKAGWPFEVSFGQAAKDADHDELCAKVIEALDEGKPVLDALKADVPSAKRLEIMAELLLLFLDSMPDGIINEPLWTKIEQALPGVAAGKSAAETEEIKTAVLDILSTAPYNNISFVFLTSMLLKVSGELMPLGQGELRAMAAVGAGNKPAGGGTMGAARRSLSFRRSLDASLDMAAIQRRLAWERRTAEIFGNAVCRSAVSPAAAHARERRAVDDRMRGVLEAFMRRPE